jgi:hypothetical protein
MGGNAIREVFANAVEIMPPAFAHTLPMRRIEETYRPVPQAYLGSAGALFQTQLQMIQSRVRHEHRTAELQQNWGLDHLHMAPEMADAIAPIAEPSSTWPLLQDHLHRISVGVGTAFAKAVEYTLKDIANVGLHLDVLFNVQCHIFEFH